MGSYIGEGLTFSEAKKRRWKAVEGADLAKEMQKIMKISTGKNYL